MCRRIAILTSVLILAARPSPALAQVPTKVMPTPPVPSKSLPTHQGTARVTRSFSAQGIEAVYLRAGAAEEAEVKTILGRPFITVSGVPEGDARGYHSADPNWRETPAALWGLNFTARPYGSSLVISSEKEILYIHHHYHLAKIVIEVPPGVKVIKENRRLTGEAAPDLSAPGRKRD